MATRAAWAILALLLLATLIGAATVDRRSWPGLVGDEATYLMQAESLAWDHDLVYERADYERFVRHWGKRPEGVILQSGDDGRTLVYGKPPFYALWTAPFVRISPTRGAPFANALLLALVAVLAARALAPRLGAPAPLWVAVSIFASVLFLSVWWAHADLFLACLVAAGFALATGRAERTAAASEVWEDATTEPRGRWLARWLAVGALLGLVGVWRPFYAALFLPAALAVPRARRRSGLAALAAGALLVATGSFAVSAALTGSPTSYGGERMAFYSNTGFPDVELEEGFWEAEIERRGRGSWFVDALLDPTRLQPSLMGWNLLDFAIGRHVGVLIYFLPLVLGFMARRRDALRWALPVAVALAVAGFFFVRPFNYYGGGGAIANRYFLPLYPALWFLAGRPARWLPAIAVTVLAAPFLLPSWSAPRAYPFTAEGAPRYVSSLARDLLPYETTQDHLKPSGRDDLVHGTLWIKLLDPALRPEADGQRFVLARPGCGELLVGSPVPLTGLTLHAEPPGATDLQVQGAEAGATTLLPTGASQHHLTFTHPTRRHRMWWTRDPFDLYRLEICVGEGRGGKKLRFWLEAAT